MIKSILISLSLLVTVSAWAQQDSNGPYATPAKIIRSYLDAAAESDSLKRSAAFSELFLNEALVMSLSANPKANMILGSWQDFVSKSQSFLNQYDLSFEEYERELDYYADLASAHLILKQVVHDQNSGRRFEQMMWMQMELVFMNDRWHISSVLWSSGGESSEIFDALKQDTLWNRIDP